MLTEEQIKGLTEEQKADLIAKLTVKPATEVVVEEPQEVIPPVVEVKPGEPIVVKEEPKIDIEALLAKVEEKFDQKLTMALQEKQEQIKKLEDENKELKRTNPTPIPQPQFQLGDDDEKERQRVTNVKKGYYNGYRNY